MNIDLPDTALPARFTLSRLPPGHPENGVFSLAVEWGGAVTVDGRQLWAINRGGGHSLYTDGTWDANRWPGHYAEGPYDGPTLEEWLLTARYSDLDLALRLADDQLNDLIVNGWKVDPSGIIHRADSGLTREEHNALEQKD